MAFQKLSARAACTVAQIHNALCPACLLGQKSVFASPILAHETVDCTKGTQRGHKMKDCDFLFLDWKVVSCCVLFIGKTTASVAAQIVTVCAPKNHCLFWNTWWPPTPKLPKSHFTTTNTAAAALPTDNFPAGCGSLGAHLSKGTYVPYLLFTCKRNPLFWSST